MNDQSADMDLIKECAAAFLHPTRRAPVELIPNAIPIDLGAETEGIHAWSIGTGPSVMLLHGWEGTISDMAAFVPGLLSLGLRAVLVELPAHGQSEKQWTSIPHSAKTLKSMQEKLGAVHAVVGHSVGGAVVAHAMGLGMQAGRVVLVSTPARYIDYAQQFAHQAGLSAQEASRMLEVLRNDWQVDVRLVSTPDTMARVGVPGLVIHAFDDRIVPMRDAEFTASQWANSRLLQFDGVGHRRILGHPPVIDSVMEFLQGGG